MTINIAKKQHIVPRRSLLRFGDESGLIEVRRPEQRGSFRAHAKNPVFCVNSVWDHRTEFFQGKRIEDSFQSIVDNAIRSGSHRLTGAESLEITKFFALWLYRSQAVDYNDFGTHAAMTPSVVDHEEKLKYESLGIGFVDETGSFPQAMQRGWFIAGGIISFLDRHRDDQWSMCRASGYEFMISDNPAGNLFIPIAPDRCLIADYDVPLLSPDQCRQANLMTMVGAKRFYCARDLSRCL